MKVLLIDDGEAKAQAVRKLCDEGLDGAVIELVHRTSTREAAQELAAGRFDLVVLDIFIPEEVGKVASPENAISLVDELYANKRFVFPTEIIALTQKGEESNAPAERLAQLGIATLRIHPEFDWEGALGVVMKSALVKAQRIPSNPIDREVKSFAFFTALTTPEFSSLLGLFPDAKHRPHPFIEIYEVTITLDDAAFEGLLVCAGGPGMCRMALAANTLLTQFEIGFLGLCGITGGNSEHVALGDLILSDESWDIHAGKWVDDPESGPMFKPDMHMEHCTVNPAKVEQFVLREKGFLTGIWSDLPSPKPRSVPQLVPGPTACSSAVIASSDKLHELELNRRKVIGVEMEAFGLYSAVKATQRSCRAVCIKAVSDLCDKEKSDNYQVYCSGLSARVLIELFTAQVFE